MLSKKMAFSLTSLIIIFALAFAVPSVMAQVSVEVMGLTTVNHAGTAASPADTTITLTVKTDKNVASPTVGSTGDPPPATELLINTFTKGGTAASTQATVAATTGATNTGMMHYYTVTVPTASLVAADLPLRIVVTVPALSPSDPSDDTAASKAVYHVITVRTALAANTSRPQVVSIQRLRPGSQTVVAAFQEAEVTGAFNVRIVLTEKGHKPGKGDAINAGDLEVTNGTASGWTVGVPFSLVGQGDAGAVLAAGTTPAADDVLNPHPIEGMYAHAGDGALAGVPAGADSMNVPMPTGDDAMYHQYRVTITPHRRADMVKIHVKEFHDNAAPFPNVYKPFDVGNKPNGREQLRLKVNIPKFDLEDGLKVVLPHAQKAKITYANSTAGHYILARNKAGSHIRYFNHEDTGTAPRENKAKEQTPAQLLYNVRASNSLPNLETFLANHGTIHLVSYHKDSKAGDAYISEVMWGTDASQNPVSNSNWIEIRNATDKAIDIGNGEWALWFYEAHETPAADYPADSAYEGPIGQAGTIIDVIGTKASDTGLSWSIAGKGQSGRSNIDIARAEEHVLSPTTPLVSMYRTMEADTSTGAAVGAMKPKDGTMSGAWMQTPGPSVNLAVGRENAIVATPGAAPFDTPDTAKAEADAAKAKADAAAAAQKTADSTGTIPSDGQIYISEIMFAGGGTLPQWIEISNGSRTEEVNLSGWTLSVVNSAADADVSVGAAAQFTIPAGTKISPSGQSNTPSTILVVTEKGRTNLTGPKASGQVVVLDAPGSSTEVELILAGVTTRKYTLLSDMAFMLTLAPPVPAATKPPAGETAAAKATRMAAEARAAATRKMATDMVGNLSAGGSAAWALPMSEDGGRSSIIRRHIQVARGPAAPEDGTMADNWVLASDTSFAQVTHIRAASFYGAANDVGTPGFRPGGALPVELSHFRPARDKATGSVVITWATQSELNNAGFFIKRSNQRDGEFKVINATMVAGAGTTSEKQFYTYTDTTAQPNIVYYYQIEDVSLDGNRQTLTRGIRLKGHIGAAGKATTLWGELKTSHE